MLRLEEQVLGIGTPLKFRALEQEVNALLKKKMKRKAQEVQDHIRAEWLPVKHEEEQRAQQERMAKDRAIEERETQLEQRYWAWRDHSWEERLNHVPLVVGGGTSGLLNYCFGPSASVCTNNYSFKLMCSIPRHGFTRCTP